MTTDHRIAEEYADLFKRLAQSSFRSQFKISKADSAYIETKGLETIKSHAVDFIGSRIAPADPRNDGKQTPLRGHPVFKAQHATATCCRGCIAKWHGIAQGQELSAEKQRYLVNIIITWIELQIKNA